jgi:uncharacterized protein (DUF488 family)
LNSVWTIGHSNDSIEKLVSMLQAHNTEIVIDVRRFPASRKWPHFNAEALASTLPAAGIAYQGLPELGGRRRPRPDSPHRAWRVEAFRGYADFMDTPEFAAGREKIEEIARQKRAVLMCAEALPWRCHRSLIADTLVVRGWEVWDVLSEKEVRGHRLPDFARVSGGQVIYDL